MAGNGHDDGLDDGLGDDRSPGHQFAMVEVIGDFEDHDVLGLAGLTPAGRAEQLAARQSLHAYLTDLWEHAKAVGERPGDDPAFEAIAALRDLADALRAAASLAQADAGD